MNVKNKTLLSGIKPTGRPHIGNYFGAMRQFVDLQDSYQSFIMIADLHALTSVQNHTELQSDIIDLAIDYLAIGLDPQKTILFRQSEVPAHTELAWIFNCLTTMPYLMRAHAFKDAEARNKEINVGVFTYPTLMAADILLYEPDIVPVGADQKQHLEYARDIAEKFNHIFGQTFKLPQSLIMPEVEIVPGLDGQKMSKSYNNTIPLFAEDIQIRELVMKIITDSSAIGEAKDPEKDNVFALHKLFSADSLEDLKQKYLSGSINHKESKELLAENMIKFISPLRARRQEVASDLDKVKKILSEGSKLANDKAQGKLNEAKAQVGLLL